MDGLAPWAAAVSMVEIPAFMGVFPLLQTGLFLQGAKVAPTRQGPWPNAAWEISAKA